MSSRTKMPINKSALSFAIHGGVLVGVLFLVPAAPFVCGTIFVASAVGAWASLGCKDPKWTDAMRERYSQGRY